MTAALAHELELSVRYQSAYLEETWSRNGNLLFASGHVNITLGRRMIDAGTNRDYNPWTIDFLPAEEIRSMRVRDIDESTVLAMYANNRAAEALARGKLNDAYAWAAEAMRKDPTFLNSYNTLGVVYLRHDHPAQAERVFALVLEREPKNTRALANLAEAYTRQGRGRPMPRRRAPAWRRSRRFRRSISSTSASTPPSAATGARPETSSPAKWRAPTTTTSSTSGSAWPTGSSAT